MVSGPNYVVRKGLTGCMQHYPLNFMQSEYREDNFPLSVYKLKMYASCVASSPGSTQPFIMWTQCVMYMGEDWSKSTQSFLTFYQRQITTDYSQKLTQLSITHSEKV